MRALRPYKFLVMPVLQLEEDGVVIGEKQPEAPDVCFGVEGLAAYAAGFEDAVAKQNAAYNAGTNGTGPTEEVAHAR